MERGIVDLFMQHEEELKEALPEEGYETSYEDLLTRAITAVNPDDSYGFPSPKRITKIDEGDYQGTLVFIVGESGYQPSTYWVTKVSYGSCSGCDTLQAANCKQDLWTLMLHMMQNLQEV